jgi:ABC-2 type transport system permease protein
MRKALIILEKEWLELRGERTLWMTILIPPLLLTILPIVAVYLIGVTPDEDSGQLGAVIADPSFAGLSDMELGQAVMGKQFGLMFLIMPLLIPSAIASYSIVGEKTRRTLEPLLAAPIQTWELLLGKCLASLVPAIVISWGAALIFVLALRLVVLSDQVYRVILGGGWWVLLLLGSPSLALLMVAATVAISGRVNDPRTAQQVAAVVVVPILALFIAQLLGVVVLTPLLAFIASAALAFLAALSFAGAIVLFDRENILTRWTS